MSTVPITLIFADGVARQIPADGGASVVAAAAEAGMTLLTDCANGQCGTCAAQLVAGAIDLDGYDRAILPDADRADGQILTCVSRVTGPCVVELPYDFSEAMADPLPPLPGIVEAIERVAAETVRLAVRIDRPLAFEPGQYVRLRPAGATGWRSYSMASAPGSDLLVFYVRLVDGGAFSTWLTGAAAVGTALEVSEPHGAFFLRDEARPRLFVAGGTGLAPFLSMLAVLRDDPRRAAVPTTLLLGVRTGEHLFGLDALQAYVGTLPSFTVELAAERDPTDRCRPGYATDLIGALTLHPDTRLYLCGPPSMVDAGRDAAASAGLARREMLCERFN